MSYFSSQQNDLKLKYALNTHVHADHITGSGALKRRIAGAQSAISQVSGGQGEKETGRVMINIYVILI